MLNIILPVHPACEPFHIILRNTPCSWVLSGAVCCLHLQSSQLLPMYVFVWAGGARGSQNALKGCVKEPGKLQAPAHGLPSPGA
jgi:hypothetical protein